MEASQNYTIRELHNIQIVYCLTRRNYLNWSQLVRAILKGQGKMNHFTGTGLKLEDLLFIVWDKEDSIIML